MIDAAYCQLMARYNAWQNRSLVEAADTLSHEDRWRDRGAFFGSIARTLNHILWDDGLWLARFDGNERPEETLKHTPNEPTDWEIYKALRFEQDKVLLDWAEGLGPVDFSGQVAWYPAGGTERIEKPRALCIAHLFNHQTHHRGQVHSMLTAAGANPEPTDLPMLG